MLCFRPQLALEYAGKVCFYDHNLTGFIIHNPYLTNGFSHHYNLGESTISFRGVRSDFYFLSHFLMKFLCANRIAPDGTPHCGAILFAYVP